MVVASYILIGSIRGVFLSLQMSLGTVELLATSLVNCCPGSKLCLGQSIHQAGTLEKAMILRQHHRARTAYSRGCSVTTVIWVVFDQML